MQRLWWCLTFPLFFWRGFLTMNLFYGGLLVATDFCLTMMSSSFADFHAAVSFLYIHHPPFSSADIVGRPSDFFVPHLPSSSVKTFLVGPVEILLCARSILKRCACAQPFKCWEIFQVGWIASFTIRALRDFSSYTDPAISIFLHSYCAYSAVVIDRCFKSRSSTCSFAKMLSVT